MKDVHNWWQDIIGKGSIKIFTILQSVENINKYLNIYKNVTNDKCLFMQEFKVHNGTLTHQAAVQNNHARIRLFTRTEQDQLSQRLKQKIKIEILAIEKYHYAFQSRL